MNDDAVQGPRFGTPGYRARDGYAVGALRRDKMTGQAIRRHNYEDQNGIDGE